MAVVCWRDYVANGKKMLRTPEFMWQKCHTLPKTIILNVLTNEEARATAMKFFIISLPLFHVIITLAASCGASSIMIIYWALKVPSSHLTKWSADEEECLSLAWNIFLLFFPFQLSELDSSSKREMKIALCLCIFSQLLQSAFLWCYK